MQIKDLIPWGRKKGEAPPPAATAAGDGVSHPASDLRRDINRMFDDFWSRLERPFFGGDHGLSLFGPRTDVAETGDAVEVSVELPGMDERDIDVSLADGTLTIRGEKKAEREQNGRGYYLSERSYGSFFRTVPLPPGIDSEKASAEFKRGVLTVRLPKSDEAQARVKKIGVKAG